MIDSTRSLAVVDQRAAGTTELAVECHGGGEAQEALEDALAESLRSARPVALEGQPVLAGPEDRLDALANRGEARATSRPVVATGPLDGPTGRYLRLTGSRVETLEPRGTGDSMFAALGASLASAHQLGLALRLAMAAGCLNVTRHGLGTGTRRQIEHLSNHIEIRELTRLAGG